MKKFIPTFLFFTIILGACAPASTVEITSTPAPSATITTIPTSTKTSKPTNTAIPDREATLSEVENNVSAQIEPEAEFISAKNDMVISEGGGVETGKDGKARLDLLPDGTIVRVGPNSSFTLPELDYKEGEPKTTIELLFGSIFILLNGGTLDVETPSGVASVRGSLLNVDYDPETGFLNATCLEGHCGLKNPETNEQVEFGEGQKSFIEFKGRPPMPPQPMNQNDVQLWLNQAPEIQNFLPRIPDPKDFPPPPNDIPLIQPLLPPSGSPQPGGNLPPINGPQQPGGNLPPPPNGGGGLLPPPP